MLNFVLASIIVGSGIIIGAILGIIAKEELKVGKKYFNFLKNILFSSILLIIAGYYLKISYFISIIFLVFFLIFFVKKIQNILIYLIFSAGYILSYIDINLNILISSLIFLAGFPIGSLIAYEFRKDKYVYVNKKVLIPYFIFISVIFLRYSIL